MTETQARARLTIMVASSSDPALSTSEFDQLVGLARRTDRNGTPAYPARLGSTLYAVGQIVTPAARNGHIYRCSIAGTTAPAAPVWPTSSGATVTDGTVTWTEWGPDQWIESYDLNVAAAEGWRWKAAKVASEFDFVTDGNQFARSQKYAHCIAQAEHYARKIARSVRLTGWPPAQDELPHRLDDSLIS